MESKDFRISFGSHGTEPHQQKLEPYPIILVDYTGPQTARSFFLAQLRISPRTTAAVSAKHCPNLWELCFLVSDFSWWGGVVKLGGKATTMAIGNPETHPAIEACHGERFHRTKDATMDPQIVLHCGGSKCQRQGNGKRQQEVVDVFWRIDFLNTEIINCWVC